MLKDTLSYNNKAGPCPQGVTGLGRFTILLSTAQVSKSREAQVWTLMAQRPLGGGVQSKDAGLLAFRPCDAKPETVTPCFHSSIHPSASKRRPCQAPVLGGGEAARLTGDSNRLRGW